MKGSFQASPLRSGWLTVDDWLTVDEWQWVADSDWQWVTDSGWLTDSDWLTVDDWQWVADSGWLTVTVSGWLTVCDWHVQEHDPHFSGVIIYIRQWISEHNEPDSNQAENCRCLSIGICYTFLPSISFTCSLSQMRVHWSEPPSSWILSSLEELLTLSS